MKHLDSFDSRRNRAEIIYDEIIDMVKDFSEENDFICYFLPFENLDEESGLVSKRNVSNISKTLKNNNNTVSVIFDFKLNNKKTDILIKEIQTLINRISIYMQSISYKTYISGKKESVGFSYGGKPWNKFIPLSSIGRFEKISLSIKE